jgi:hypothetical protein
MDMFHKFLPALLACCAMPALATTSYYIGSAGETAFNQALDNSSLILSGPVNFTGTTSGNVISDVGGTGVDVKGFISNSPSTLTVNGSTVEMFTTQGSPDNRIEFALPENTYALGVHVSSTFLTGTLCFGVPGICTNSLSSGLNTSHFFGVISDTPLTMQAVWSLANIRLTALDFKIGTMSEDPSNEVPEPSTMALLGSALIALPLLARRRRR